MKPDSFIIVALHELYNQLRQVELQLDMAKDTARLMGDRIATLMQAPKIGPDVSDCSWDEIERIAIETVLAKNRGNKKATAKQLCIGRQTLYNRIKSYKIGVNGDKPKENK